MTMHLTCVLLVFCWIFVINCGAAVENSVKTLHGYDDPPPGKTLVINADQDEPEGAIGSRRKRAAVPTFVDPSTKINHLNDTHKQLMVHWVGEKSKVVICLARDPASGLIEVQSVNPSAVYISYDDGDTYVNKTESFKTKTGTYATLDKFYNHPKYNTHFVFTDVRHKMIYVTKDHGKTFKPIELDFTPSDLSFHDLQASTFVVLDKTEGQNKLWVTEDFGETFRVSVEFVKSFFWIPDSTTDQRNLLVQRFEPNGLSTIVFSQDLFKSRHSFIYTTNVKDVYMKNDYVFTTKNSQGKLELYVRYNFGKEMPCVFDSNLDFLNFLIVDVTGNRAFVVVNHSGSKSNLYVSDNLGGNDGKVRFTLSLPNVFAFFPNSTTNDSWLKHLSEDAFADVYKVEGLSGIYIASRVISNSSFGTISPQNLGSVITFDHGATWRLIQPPADDVEGQSTGCLRSKGCSLHLTQKFNYLHPETRSVSILSTKSAPGIIIATGVLGPNLKGHYGVYVSLDAGLTWRQTLRDLYYFNMGDHGGILTAVKYYRSQGETRHILYSIDEGENWNETVFHNEDIRLYGLMTEPGENTTVFTMFGSLPKEHRWIIVKVDFKNVFKSQCKPDDYKMWSPSQSDENRSYIPCILGEQTTFQRRMPHALCLNGLDYVRVVSKQVCDCDAVDFECDFGFKKEGHPPRCIRDDSVKNYDPYAVPKNCKPGTFYNRTKGYRKISGDVCVQGFESHYLPDQVPCPFGEINAFLLFAQRERISRFDLITKRVEELPVKNLKNVIAIDFDMQNNCVYWADIALDTIGRQCFANGSKPELLVSTDLASIEGMAYNWISKTLYFVDGVRAKIEMIRTDINHSGRMRKTILDKTVLHKPRGIALHPQNGYMFWTDWSAENPSVNRANLDGSNNITLFGKDRVEWPNGITIDYIANRIYWVDAKKDYIGSSDLHGDRFVKVVTDTDVVSHPFAVAVFKDNMYWDDWKINSIFGANKDHFKGVEVLLERVQGLMDLKVYAHGIQIGTDACLNATCPYICVGLPKNNRRCLCPDGMESKDDGCVCPGNVTPYSNWTCPTVDKSCSPEHFACGNGVCIPKGWKCDGEDDCGDNWDEAHCGIETCPPNYHSCGDGKCLPSYWRCDYDNDCADGSDEMNCPRQNCTAGQFACDNGRCISIKWKCDGENDCRDNSDERNCSPDKPSTCKSDEFHCRGGAVTCIPSTWKCDGEPDCRDGSDEVNCADNVCIESTQFSCGQPTYRCIYNTWVCDGDRDCPNGKDEENCTVTIKPDIPKPPTQFVPRNGICQDWMFKCKNERCIPLWWKCDKADDCGDGSDESGCPYGGDGNGTTTATTPKPAVICETNQFQCVTGDCIPMAWVCDSMYDCPGYEDELHCEEHLNCTENQFKCRTDGNCIQRDKVCDGKVDCPDKSDEDACEHNLPNGPATPSCSMGFFPCDGTCNPLAVLCDGKIDCKDGYDEMNCKNRSRVYQVMQMYNDERVSNSTTILLNWWMPSPYNVKLEYLPAISKVGENKWRNTSWTDNTEYKFTGLQPFTKYNMTVYVRIQNTDAVFPPAKYFISSTQEGIPSEPLNVTAVQKNGTHVLLSWVKPVRPNGIIVNYQIIWAPPNSSEIRLKLSGNETSHLLSAEFEHNKIYTFYVTAFNRLYESNRSIPAVLRFEGEVNLSVKDLKVVGVTNTSINLSWTYDGRADGFKITIEPEKSYPKLPPIVTKSTGYNVSLAPGATYIFRVYPVRKGIDGTAAQVTASTTGSRLPEITTLEAIVSKDVGTTVKLSWQRPEKMSKVKWFYGIYYGTDQEELFRRPMMRTSNLTATVTNLDACETYIFAVGIVGPYGYGPLSKNIKEVTTSDSPLARPKKVTVEGVDNEPLKMKVTWEPSCPDSVLNETYMVSIMETTTNRKFRIKLYDVRTYTFDIEYGGIYVVQVARALPNASLSKPALFYAPPILPPLEVNVVPELNGSYFVYWQERKLPTSMGPYKYEVLVQPGNTLDESKAQKIEIDRPPLVYTNTSSDSYTFAVRIKTDKGLKSLTSALINKVAERPVQSSVNMPAILIPSIIAILTLVALSVFLVVRNRRLHNSFVRFANSHYNSRSGAATFDDHGLEEEESPRIVGFSDDEPLVIA